MNLFKQLTIGMLTATIICSASAAYATDIYDITEEKAITNGIVHKNIKRLTDKGWQNINVIEADLSDGKLAVKALTNPEDISTLMNVQKLADAHGTIASINSDFFAWKWDEKTKGSAIGGVIDDGVLKTSITSPWNFATVAQKMDGAFIFDYIDCKISVTTPNEAVTAIEHINKYDDLTQPIIYTTEWGKLSPGSQGTVSEIVIVDDKVVSVNYDQGPVEIPENGYIISFLRDLTPELLENFHEGDEVALDITYTPAFENIQFAVGAGTLLLKDGKKVDNINDIAGNHPRTAIGISKDHSKLYLVTVDGRQSNAKGVTIDSLSDIMLGLGANDAANLDGGGSTTMVLRSPFSGNQEVVNTLSDKYLRAVANGVGIVPTEKAKDDLFLAVKTDSDCVFAGTGISIDATVTDGAGNIVNTPLAFSYSDGTMKNGLYYPETPGIQTVTVSSTDGLKASIDLRVLDKPVKISTGLKEYNIKQGDSAYIAITAYDSKGYRAFVNLNDLYTTLSSSAVSVDGNNLKGTLKGSALATFEFGDVRTSAVVRVGGDKKDITIPEDITIPDSISSPTENGTFKFAVFGSTVDKKTLTEKHILRKYVRTLEEAPCDLAVFVGNDVSLSYKPTADTIRASNNYSYAKYDDNAFITIGGTKAEQWKSFLNDAKTAKAKNIFLFMPDSIAEDSGYFEEMLIDYTEKNLSDTNVYVIHSGENKVSNSNGIKYIGIPGVEAIENVKSISDASYYVFTVDDQDVHMEEIKIFK